MALKCGTSREAIVYLDGYLIPPHTIYRDNGSTSLYARL